MRNKLLSTVCAALLGLCVPHHANAVNYGYLRITDNEACTSQAYSQSADILYQKQASFYMAAYGSGTMTMQAMAERLRVYADVYPGLDAEFADFLAIRNAQGVDFAQPIAYVRALADFLASVEVDTHMPAMCDAVEEKSKATPFV